MKFGVADYGMNVWDGGRFDIEARLRALKAVGFDGVERLQAVTEANALYEASVFRRLGMDFTTCEAPNPALSMVLTAALGKEYVWLEPGDNNREVPFEVFCRRANGFIDAAERCGIHAGLHNHLGCRIQTQEELEAFLTACPKAQLLLDIGHLHAAGGDCLAIIRKYTPRLCAVHFKDVYLMDAGIGLDQWWKRLRFCELGAGNCGLDYAALAQELVHQHYTKWFLIEHDTHTADPVQQLKLSLERLQSAI